MAFAPLNRASAMDPLRSDFSVFDRTGEVKLVVEAKSRVGVSQQWAAQMRRNLLAHGMIPKAKYFLLALPDRFYLWQGEEDPLSTALPTDEIDASKLLAPYLAPAGLAPDAVSEGSLELVVGAWLWDFLRLEELPAELRDEHPRLAELHDELRGGHVVYGAVA
jgi:hypothetical protein